MSTKSWDTIEGWGIATEDMYGSVREREFEHSLEAAVLAERERVLLAIEQTIRDWRGHPTTPPPIARCIEETIRRIRDGK